MIPELLIHNRYNLRRNTLGPALETIMSFGLAADVFWIFCSASTTRLPVVYIHSVIASFAARSIGMPETLANV